MKATKVIASLLVLCMATMMFCAPVVAASQLAAAEGEPGAAIPAGHAYIPKGVDLRVETVRDMSSGDLKTGAIVPLRMTHNLMINGVVVVPVGTRVDGEITKASKAGAFGHSGKLVLAVRSVETVNGVTVPLQASLEKHHGNEDGAIGVALFVSLLGGAFMKGRNAFIPAKYQIEAEVAADTDLGIPLANLAEAMNPAKPHGINIELK